MVDRNVIHWAIDNEVTLADLEIIGLPSRLIEKFDSLGVIKLEQLLEFTFDELKNISGIGTGYINSIKRVLINLPRLQSIKLDTTCDFSDTTKQLLEAR